MDIKFYPGASGRLVGIIFVLKMLKKLWAHTRFYPGASGRLVIMPDILKMALEHQKGRGIDEYAQGHNFTERWFRDSGLYELNSEYQSNVYT